MSCTKLCEPKLMASLTMDALARYAARFTSLPRKHQSHRDKIDARGRGVGKQPGVSSQLSPLRDRPDPSPSTQAGDDQPLVATAQISTCAATAATATSRMRERWTTLL